MRLSDNEARTIAAYDDDYNEVTKTDALEDGVSITSTTHACSYPGSNSGIQ